MGRNQRRSLRGSLTAVLLLGLGLTPLCADTGPTVRSIADNLAAWSATLNTVAALDDSDAGFLDAATDARRVQHEVHEARADVAQQLAAVRRELAALGPAPDDDDPTTEPPSLARMRRRLEAEEAAWDASQRQADALIARANTLQSQFRRLERHHVRIHLLQRGPSPLNPTIWPRAVSDVGRVLGTLDQVVRAWWVREPPATPGWRPFLWPIPFGILAMIAGLWLRVRLRRTFGRTPEIEAPDAGRRLIAATAASIAATIAPALVSLTVLVTLVEFNAVAGSLTIAVARLVGAALLLIALPTLALAAFPISEPHWRLVGIDDTRTRTVRRRLLPLAVFLAATGFISAAPLDVGQLSREFDAARDALLTIPFAALLLLLTPRNLWHLEDPADKTSIWDSLRLGTNATAFVVLVAALGGWSHLAHEVVRTVIVSGMALLAFTIIRSFLYALLALALAAESPHSAQVRDFLGIEERGATVALFWLRLWLDAALAIGGAVAWMLAVGVPSSTLAVWAAASAEGIKIGSFHIAFVDILIAALAVAAVLGLTRFIRHTLEERILPQTQLGSGAQHSLTTAFRYAGLVAAAAVGISMLGLDLSNVALVAGALSVGIGFGLQNVVNNFVSGLIMLVERPIKVGDWVVLGGNEGIVKRINVRATEIETFQRSAVIIPNSQILASAIVNWTHRDQYGRLEVPVGVAYGSDVQKVRKILLACANGHDQIASLPAPYVLFRDFGASSLDFELRAFLRQNMGRLRVMSDLRFAIDAAFRRNSIEIPFAQHDLHFRDLDRLDEMLRGRTATPVDTPPPARRVDESADDES